MSPLLLIFITALVFALSATPLARQIALRIGLIDQPSARKFHTRPIPVLGGLAIYGAFVIALILFADRFYIPQLIGIIVGATWMSLLGIWDDRVGLHAAVKLIGQILSALILIATGVTVILFQNIWLDTALALIWIVGVTNALNLVDNMDGLSGGIAAIAAAFFLLIAALNGQYLVSILAAALLGAALGFLLYNFNPASIFMGDAGALFLGFVLAAVGIKLRFVNNTYVVTWMVPVLILGVPIFDTLLVVLSRLRRRAPIYRGGLDHLSHRLVARGLSPRVAVQWLYLASIALGAIALIVMEMDIVPAYGIGIVVGAVALMALWEFEFSKKGFDEYGIRKSAK
ncbi:MAG: undecaprenyl/decaprenyl-phosphate alpha-N-acetylglucosaminyl 1-phosphate transferase [Chloroflexi bacterium]|nr:undecaprenyl/decaprenyl-phosphate alpha-N-acetylglucosaminyl 1-phosphate transferase [Chloroflexota bacterium]